MINKPQKALITDVESIRLRARSHLERGAVTPGYAGDREVILKLLNDALATEIVCMLQYKFSYHTAQGIHSKPIADEFLSHAREEEEHADLFAARIRQLGGRPDYNPEGLATRSHTLYREGQTLLESIQGSLIAERIAIESYSEVIRYLGDKDPTTRRLFEAVLAKEEEHADDLSSLIQTMLPGERIGAVA